LTEIDYDKLYLNTPVRPPAEANVRAVDHEDMLQAEKMLGGISIDLLVSSGFHSEINDDLESIISIIKRHPMNQHEVISFLVARNNQEPETIIRKLNLDPRVETINYKGYTTFRLK
ncbi:MAG: radical SAM protein, partial [Bacilli bacterium]|nr:radical SAM protein [Bacilli bacterium]